MVNEDVSILVKVRGLVQGVGFRPFVYRIALMNEISGWVKNTNEAVLIRIQGKNNRISSFMQMLWRDAPLASSIESIESESTLPVHFIGFKILESDSVSDESTEISPDIAVCPECLNDMTISGNRFQYSFVNCTNCGPRFTIVDDLPYDRKNTSMAHFPMCERCRQEYEDIADRRFHAQPVACITCGPLYSMASECQSEDPLIIPDKVADMLDTGNIIAIKGLGGFHLACDAANGQAVKRLRKIKNREGKPFAVMARDLDSARMFASISPEEEQSLVSWRRPIVLLDQKNGTQPSLSVAINAGLSRIGIMLPYLPFHYQLFTRLKTKAIVLTSGNFSKEPILIDNTTAIQQFMPVVDEVVIHNREILNRTDDSVVLIANRKERIIRRSRGYVPASFITSHELHGIVALGADLTNSFCIGNGKKAILSQYIGDLENYETSEFFEELLHKFLKLFRIKPAILAADLHPDYHSSGLGESFARQYGTPFRPLPVVRIQHHHAHIASCMAEHSLDERVIGVSFDGIGFGSDGKIWGAEFLVCDLVDFKRMTHLEYLPMPGGDKAAEEPWRMAVSYLYKIYGDHWMELQLPLMERISKEKALSVTGMIESNINCPLVSSAGRLFDAVAAIMGLCSVASFQAEAPMRLESMIEPGVNATYSFQLCDTIDVSGVIQGIVEDLKRGLRMSVISAKFHNTLVSIILETVKSISEATGILKVVLSGGVFQNKYLLEETENQLISHTFEVYSHQKVPSNDGGIALGQAVIVAKRRELCV